MASILDGHIEEIIEKIIEGKTFREMAAEFNCAIGTLHKFLSSDEHSARTRAALQVSASSYADKAEEVLILAERDSIEMTRARELAQHYRWKAAKRSPNSYGDKIDIKQEIDSKTEIKGSIDLSHLSLEELKSLQKLQEKAKSKRND